MTYKSIEFDKYKMKIVPSRHPWVRQIFFSETEIVLILFSVRFNMSPFCFHSPAGSFERAIKWARTWSSDRATNVPGENGGEPSSERAIARASDRASERSNDRSMERSKDQASRGWNKYDHNSSFRGQSVMLTVLFCSMIQVDVFQDTADVFKHSDHLTKPHVS